MNNPMLMNERFTAAFPSLIRALSGDVLTAVVLQAVNYRAAITDADSAGEVWVQITMQEIADELGVSLSQTKRALTKLRELGWISSRNAEGYNNNKLWTIHHETFTDQKSHVQPIKKPNSANRKDENDFSTTLLEVKRTITNKPTQVLPDEAYEMAELLAELIVRNGSKPPKVTPKWVKDLELMHRVDERSWDEIRAAIIWCQNDSFWRGNIMSPNKLRDQFDRLRMAAQRTQTGNNYANIFDAIQPVRTRYELE